MLFSQKLADTERNPPHPLQKKRSALDFDDASCPVQKNPSFPDNFISHFPSHSRLAVQGGDRESGGGGEQLCRRGGWRVLSKHWRGSSFYIVSVHLYTVLYIMYKYLLGRCFNGCPPVSLASPGSN